MELTVRHAPDKRPAEQAWAVSRRSTVDNHINESVIEVLSPRARKGNQDSTTPGNPGTRHPCQVPTLIS